ncbi:hypothetical protein ES703_76547 [subsurface metagenome]
MECPFTKKSCSKDQCAWWIELIVDEEKRVDAKQSRCAVAWITILLIELRKATEKKTNVTNEE